MLAHSNDQECYCINHCGPVLLVYIVLFVASIGANILASVLQVPSLATIGYVGICAFWALWTILRRNLRMKNDVGSPDSWLGDCFMMCCICTEPCSYCQLMRSMPVSKFFLIHFSVF